MRWNVGIKKMKGSRKTEVVIVVLLVAVAACGWLASEIRWARLNNPEGKFTNVAEYVAHGRLPSRVAKVVKQDATFFIAYSPMDTWLAILSSPAAYVFDMKGKMIDWSRVPGDDNGFLERWPFPREKASVEELKHIGFQQPPAEYGSQARRL